MHLLQKPNRRKSCHCFTAHWQQMPSMCNLTIKPKRWAQGHREAAGSGEMAYLSVLVFWDSHSQSATL